MNKTTFRKAFKPITFLLLFMAVAPMTCFRVDAHESAANLYYRKGEDAELEQANRKARAEFGTFERAFEQHDGDHFYVKTCFTQGNDSEHMWITVSKLKGDSIIGTLNSEPVYVKRLKTGDELVVKKSEVEDWLFSKNGKDFGGYCIKVLNARSHGQPSEQTSAR